MSLYDSGCLASTSIGMSFFMGVLISDKGGKLAVIRPPDAQSYFT